MSSGSVHYVPSSHSSSKKSFNSGSSLKNHSFSKAKTDSTPNLSNVSRSSSDKANVPKMPCSGCGKLHWKRDCPFKNATCHACKQK